MQTLINTRLPIDKELLWPVALFKVPCNWKVGLLKVSNKDSLIIEACCQSSTSLNFVSSLYRNWAELHSIASPDLRSHWPSPALLSHELAMA